MADAVAGIGGQEVRRHRDAGVTDVVFSGRKIAGDTPGALPGKSSAGSAG
ncbi:hypothetical protein ACIHCM_34475 [Streptomyces sp. NPDC052023]